ncbi:class I SAM-dependent methyltransferase [Crossiella sp. NPDC003009]
MDEKYWDTLYREREQVFSGAANGVLVTEVQGRPPGRALDVGAGEGGDALWLAGQGWQVTAADISSVALAKVAAAAQVRGWSVDTLHLDLAVAAPPAAAFDLVTASFLPLFKANGTAPLRALAEAVAPGGTLLVTNHHFDEIGDHEGHDGRVVRMADFYRPADFRPLLDEGWEVVIDELRPRPEPLPPDARHTKDLVFKAVRVRR